jgi:DNA-binding IclR family transcriptional regulator
LGQRVPLVAVLRSVSRPFLTDLFAETRAAIHMSVLDGPCVMYVEKVTGAAHNLEQSDVGRRLPACCTSSGKLLLALHPGASTVLAHFADGGLSRTTSMSVNSWEALQEQLAEVRRRGYGVEFQEAVSGFGSVAVPVSHADGVVYAAISAAQPMNQFKVDRLMPKLRLTAQGVSLAVERRLISGAAEGMDIPAMPSPDVIGF